MLPHLSMSIFKNQLGTCFWLPLAPCRLACAEAGLVNADDEVVLTQCLRQQSANPQPLVIELLLIHAQLGRVEGPVAEAKAVVDDLRDGGLGRHSGQVGASKLAHHLLDRQLMQADTSHHVQNGVDDHWILGHWYARIGGRRWLCLS